MLLKNHVIFYNRSKTLNISKEYNKINLIIKNFEKYLAIKKNVKKLIKGKDYRIKMVTKEKIKINKRKLEKILKFIKNLKNKEKIFNVFLEIRAGTGGKEATIF